MKKLHRIKKLLGFICASLVMPVLLLLLQLVYRQDMPGLSHFNLYLQPIIAGFVIDIFFAAIVGLSFLAYSLLSDTLY